MNGVTEMNKKLKGTQLGYIKNHFHWLIILTVVVLPIAGTSIWGAIEVLEFKTNYTNLWEWKSEVDLRVNKLEKHHVQ